MLRKGEIHPFSPFDASELLEYIYIKYIYIASELDHLYAVLAINYCLIFYRYR